jgi:hypothetical protein
MTPQQARGGHCTSGGTVSSGNAVCQCSAWAAVDYSTPEARKLARRQHLAEVETIRKENPA